MKNYASILVQSQKLVSSRFRSTAAISLPADLEKYEEEAADTVYPRPYSEIPGPKEYPIIGNAWRFAPFIGM